MGGRAIQARVNANVTAERKRVWLTELWHDSMGRMPRRFQPHKDTEKVGPKNFTKDGNYVSRALLALGLSRHDISVNNINLRDPTVVSIQMSLFFSLPSRI
jgi:hypothetical protein